MVPGAVSPGHKKSQSEDWPFMCGTSGRTRTVTRFTAPDFDINLSSFDVARLYHHPLKKRGVGRCFAWILLPGYFL